MNYTQEIKNEISTMENRDAAKMLQEKVNQIVKSDVILTTHQLKEIENEFEVFDLNKHDFYRIGTVLSYARRL